MAASRQSPPRGPGRVKSPRRSKPKADRPQVIHSRAAYGKPIKYAQLSPKLDGLRLRWEHGQLIPRSMASALPISKRTEERRRAQRLREKAAANEGTRKRRIPKGTFFRGDMKGAMRAARRAGLITPRQQKRLHRQGRQQ